MDEFKPEDELKPDASDRRPTRPRKPSSANKVPVSRQRMMMGIGILVLLLLVIGIGSALNGNDKPAATDKNPAAGGTTAQSGAEKNIDLAGTSSGSQGNASPSAPNDVAGSTGGNGAAPATPADVSSPQQLNPPAIASTPTEGKAQPVPEGQRRVELPGDLNSALNNQQNQVNDAASGAQSDGGSTLPTAAATVAPGGARASSSKAPGTPRQSAPVKSSSAAAKHPTHKSEPAQTAKPAAKSASGAARNEQSASRAAPSGSYTLQLSGASREDSLNAWAKKQNLSSYHVYKTTRNGQPWYVLVTGAYATPAEAKRAVASLPAGVRAQNPWVKPLSQVKK